MTDETRYKINAVKEAFLMSMILVFVGWIVYVSQPLIQQDMQNQDEKMELIRERTRACECNNYSPPPVERRDDSEGIKKHMDYRMNRYIWLGF